jgi:hypothetical protein
MQLTLHEQNPSYIHEPMSHLRERLIFICAARGLPQTVRHLDDELRELEAR